MKAMKLAALAIGAGIVFVASSSGSVFSQPAVDVWVICGSIQKSARFTASPRPGGYDTKAIELCGKTYYTTNSIYMKEWQGICKRGGKVTERDRTICSW